MRGGGFLILSVLVVMAIVLVVYFAPLGSGGNGNGGGKSYMGTVLDARESARTQARAFNGLDADGERVALSATLTAPEGTFDSVLVDEVTAAGALATVYGLQAGDEIVQIGPQDVGGYVITDLDTARDFLDDAYARKLPITVKREGQRVELVPQD